MAIFKMVFEENKDKDQDSAKGLLSGYLRIFDRGFDDTPLRKEIGQRLKDDRLIESDLFFLRAYCNRVNVYKGRKYKFLKVNN